MAPCREATCYTTFCCDKEINYCYVKGRGSDSLKTVREVKRERIIFAKGRKRKKMVGRIEGRIV